jgi:hypothetical protein
VQRVDQAFRQILNEIKLQTRKGVAQSRQCARKQIRCDGGNDPEAQQARQWLLRCRDGAHQRFHIRDDGPRTFDSLVADRREHYVSLGTVNEHSVKNAFELLDAGAQRRLSHQTCPGGATKVTLFVQRCQVTQMAHTWKVLHQFFRSSGTHLLVGFTCTDSLSATGQCILPKEEKCLSDTIDIVAAPTGSSVTLCSQNARVCRRVRQRNICAANGISQTREIWWPRGTWPALVRPARWAETLSARQDVITTETRKLET